MNPNQSVFEGPRWWDGLVSGLVVFLAILATQPFAEMGFLDDFSYIKTAQVFAQTGHFVYNGWATAMLGWQIPWGALFLKLFGFSFTAARLSTWITSFATIWLFHAVLVPSGITRRNAIFGALTLGLSPLFLPLGASFMTDTNGLFVIVLCIYLCQRALLASSVTASITWLILAAVSNTIGGSVRQIAWLGVLVLVPSTAWLLRRRSGVLATGIALWCLGFVSIVLTLRWFQHQPYSIPEDVPHQALNHLPYMAANLASIPFCLCLVMLPLVVAWVKESRNLSSRAQITTAGLIAVLTGALAFLSYRGSLHDRFLVPWLKDVLGDEGATSDFNWMLGARPVSLNLFARASISLVVISLGVIFLQCVLKWRSRSASSPVGNASLPPSTMLTLLLPYTAAYFGLLVPRAMGTGVLDRYLLGIMPVAILLMLRLYQQSVGPGLPVISYVVLALFAYYGFAGTHDLFSLNRARLRAVAQMQAAGVPVTHIDGGGEFNGWTQLQASPALNDVRIRVPASLYQPQPKSGLAKPCTIFTTSFTPAVKPDYFLTFQDLPCLAKSRFVPVPYQAWLPPFRRTVSIDARP